MWKWRIHRFSLKKDYLILLLPFLNDVLLFYVSWSVNLNNFPLAVQSMYKCRFSVRFSYKTSYRQWPSAALLLQ